MGFFRRALAAPALFFLISAAAPAQDSPDPPPTDKRAFGVLPNHRTAESSIPFHSISAKEKLTIATLDSFDWPVYPTAAVFAAFYQLADQNHEFGQGMAGYGRRLGTSYADQVSGNMMTEGLMPALLHQDPRYFRMSSGPIHSRLWYSFTRSFVTKTDSGHRTFNFSEWGGASASVALSNLYYTDTRKADDNATKLLIQVGSDTIGNLLKEFWPDVKRKFKKKS